MDFAKIGTAENNAEGAEINEERSEIEHNIKTLPDNKNANAGNADVYSHEFKIPFEYEGQKYKTITFNFKKLTGADFIAVENEMTNNGEYALDPTLSRSYLSKLASKASGIPSDVVEAMPARDFKKITDAVRNFLADLES